MVLLEFKPYYLLVTLLGIGVILTITGIVFVIRRKTFPGLLVGMIGLACILLFVLAAVTNPQSLPFLN